MENIKFKELNQKITKISDEYLLKNKIKKVVVRSNLLRNDLCQILYKYQEKGLDIYFTNGYEEPYKTTIKKSKLKTN